MHSLENTIKNMLPDLAKKPMTISLEAGRPAGDD
jgi:hypothetical protein